MHGPRSRVSVMSPFRASAVVIGLFTIGAFMGGYAGHAAIARAQDPYAGLDLFAHVLTRIQMSYVDDISTDRLVSAAIRGMMDELDPHSRWLSAQEHQALEEDTEGAYEGIGVEVRPAPEGVRLERVLPNGPASIAGLQPGDLILSVDGKSLAGLSIDDVSLLLKGPRGDGVMLGVLRDGWDSPRDVRAVRDKVYTASVEGELFEKDVAYVRLSQFQKGAAADLEAELRRMAARLPPPPNGAPGTTPLSAVILDLRDNPGGLLEEAVGVTDLFLDEGVIVSTRGRDDTPQEYRATIGGLPADLPVAILINGQSASGSEIVAGALQDTRRATLVGTHSYGKGSVQTVYGYRDHSALKLTVALYYTPSGQPVAVHEGRKPDVKVELGGRNPPDVRLRKKIQDLQGVPDADRAEMLSLLAQIPEPPPEPGRVPWALHGADRLKADPQLARALELMKARHVSTGTKMH